MNYLSIIIPAYNESGRIEKTLNSIWKYLNLKKYNFEVVVVNDGSLDKTANLVKSFPQKEIKLISYQKNRGKGYAVKRGVMAARGKFLLLMDADSSTPISELPKFFKLTDSYPLVFGSRYLKDSQVMIKQKLLRRILSRWGNFLIKIFLGTNLSDTQCGFKLLNNKEAKEIFRKLTINRWGFDIEMVAIAKILGYEIYEVPVIWNDSPGSKLRALQSSFSTLKELVKIKFNLIFKKY